MTRPHPYRPEISQILADIIRVDTCDTRRCMNPLTGIWPACATVPGYRYASPDGERYPATILHSTFFILHWTYTFSAKEKDSETGLSYFGSRYYSSDLSIWLSVDQMAAKYPMLSPYVYCADNPVRLVDPDGEEVCDGGDPSKRFNDFFDKKIKTPLMKMVEDGASVDELEAAAVYLCNKYQKKLLKGYRTVTGLGRIEKIDVKVFSETEEKIEIESRPDNQEMIVCGEIPIGANVYAVEIDFNPYGVENYATFIAANKVETGWINSPEGNSFSYDLEVDGAGSMTYCIQNRRTDKRQDNWSFSVTMRSRRLDIRPELRISNCRSRKKIVRKR